MSIQALSRPRTARSFLLNVVSPQVRNLLFFFFFLLLMAFFSASTLVTGLLVLPIRNLARFPNPRRPPSLPRQTVESNKVPVSPVLLETAAAWVTARRRSSSTG